MLKAYYWLTKPGIVYGNDLPAVGGFMLASKGHLNWSLFLETIIGLSLVVASACVFNNILDRRIDSVMKRTSKRALVTGQIKTTPALIFGSLLGIIGFSLLVGFTNWLTVIVTAIGFVDYVALYGLAKRGTVHSTVIGSISGAVPPVVGYVAVTNHLDLAAWLLFVIMSLWQMPHFYAIAIYRYDDYKAAGLPILTVIKDFKAAKIQILLYILGFAVAASLLSAYGYTGYIYRVAMIVLSAWWLYKAVQGLKAKDDIKWARSLFGLSLIIMTAWSLLLAANNWLP